MKISSIKLLALTTAFASSFAFAIDGPGDDDGVQGGEIEGTESIHQKIKLAATADAPAGAAGKVKLEAENEHGTSTAKLELEVAGLPAGSYDVSVTQKSDGSTVDLGTFDVTTNPETEPGDDHGGDDDSDRDLPQAFSKSSGGAHEHEHEEISFGGEDGIALPDGLNPLDLATISIADSSAVVMLTGDFTATTGCVGAMLNAHVSITPGEGAPNATGTASLASKWKAGQLTKRFHLTARNLPADTTFAVNVNGQPVTTATSNHKGKLTIGKLKKVNSFSIHSVTLSAGGTVAAKANF